MSSATLQKNWTNKISHNKTVTGDWGEGLWLRQTPLQQVLHPQQVQSAIDPPAASICGAVKVR